jgi:hypothetical protein
MRVSPRTRGSQPELPEMRNGFWFYLPGRPEGHWVGREARLMETKKVWQCDYEECYEEPAYLVKPHRRDESLLGGPIHYACDGHIPAVMQAFCELLSEDPNLYGVTVSLR